MFQHQRIFQTAIAVLLSIAHLSSVHADRVNWSHDVESALRSASQSGRLVLMKFTADWCGYCKKMERETFTRPAVAQVVNQRFVPVLVDADKHEELVQHLKIKGLPALLVVSPEMVILSRISGFQTEEKLLPKLHNVLATHKSSSTVQTRVAGSSGFTPAPTRPVSAQVPSPAQTVSRTAATGPAFGGLCLPAVRETRSLVSGRPQFSMKYRGKTLYFSSQEYLQKFQSAPEKYWPARDGVCPVTLTRTGRPVEGKLEYAAMFRGQLWVTNSAETMQEFVAQPAAFVDALPKR